MYKINLNKGYFERRRASRLRTFRTGALAVLLTVEVVLVFTLIVSSLLLGEQASSLRAEVGRLSALVDGEASASPAELMHMARQIIHIRNSRIDWSPKLASVSDVIDNKVRLVQVVGQVAQKNGPARLSLSGVTEGAGDEMEAVTDFMKTLRTSNSIASDFPNIRLEAIEGTRSGRFRVVCDARREEPIVPSGEGS